MTQPVPDMETTKEQRELWLRGAEGLADVDAPYSYEVAKLIRDFAKLEAEVTRLREVRPDSYACNKCGRRDALDCVIPNRLWNQVEKETGFNLLCAWCLDDECAARGWQVRALLAFGGKAISAGTDPENDDRHWERHLADLTGRCFTAEAALTTARSEAIAETAWQPIETAPNDGTPIRVTGPDKNEVTHRYDGPARWNGFAWEKLHRHGFLNMRAYPTHWMPMPLPPSRRTGG